MKVSCKIKMIPYVAITLMLLSKLPTGHSENICLTRPDTNITSPSFPNKYPPNSYITWTFHTCSLMIFNFTFNELAMEISEDCKFDDLQITDLNEASVTGGPLCGNTTSHGHVSLKFSLIDYGYHVSFKSDESIEYKGFFLEVKAMTYPDNKICDRMHVKDEQRLVSIREGRYVYPTNLNCTWDISAIDGQHIILDFKHFDIEFSGPHCVFDRFEVWDISRRANSEDALLAKYCGHLYPWKLATYSQNIRLKFHSDEGSSLGYFSIKYQFNISLSEKPPPITEYRVVQPNIWQTSAVVSKQTWLTSYSFRTRPGFVVEFEISKNARKEIVLYDGPDSSYSQIESANRSKSRWFHVMAQTHGPVTLRFTAVPDKFDDWPKNQGRCSFADGLKTVSLFPNSKNCAYAGVAVFDGHELTFGNLKGVVCPIQEHYLNIFNSFLMTESSLLIYWYAPGKLPNYMHCQIKSDPLLNCQYHHFLRNRLLVSNNVLDHQMYKFVVSRINNNHSSIDIQYSGMPNDCVVLYFIPANWMINELNEAPSDLAASGTLRFHLNSSVEFSICDMWGYRSQKQSSCSEQSADCKYDSTEICSIQRGGIFETNEKGHRLEIRSGWSLQLIRIVLGRGNPNTGRHYETDADFIRRIEQSCDTNGHCNVVYDKHVKYQISVPIKSKRLINNSFYLLGLCLEANIYEKNNELNILVDTKLDRRKDRHSFFVRYISMKGIEWLRLSCEFNIEIPLFEIITFTSMEQDSYRSQSQLGVNCYQDHCYTFRKVVSSTSWRSEQKECEKNGGYLVSVNSEQELIFLHRTLYGAWFEDFHVNGRGLVYIGLNNLHQGQRYYWMDGRPLAYADWYSPYGSSQYYVLPSKPEPPLNRSQMQPADKISHRCVTMVPGNFGFSTNWRTVRCDIVHFAPVYSICEYNKTKQEHINKTNMFTSDLTPSYIRCKEGWVLINNTCYALTDSHFKPPNCSKVTETSLGHMLSLFSATEFRYTVTRFDVFFVDNVTVCMYYSFQGPYAEIRSCPESKLFEPGFIKGINYVEICESPPLEVNLTLCKPYHFQCQDGSCLNPDMVCDNTQNCNNAEDERSCSESSLYVCDNGERISLFKFCDFHEDCLDKSDEKFCMHPNCFKHQYRCSNGQCVSQVQRCDGKADCEDASDERDCDYHLECNGFKCPEGGCIPNSQREDLIPDCPDGSEADETQKGENLMDIFCSGIEDLKFSNGFEGELDIGQLGRYRCQLGHGRCYPGNKLCVYDHDIFGHLKYCRNGVHLRNCTEISCQDMYKCPNSYCLPHHKVCDEVTDCPEGEDESRCDNNTCAGRLRCGTSPQCVSFSEVCDGQVHCREGWADEQFCDLDGFVCPLNCSCLGYNISCIGQGLDDVTVTNIIKNVRVLQLDRNNISLSNNTLRGFHYLAHLSLSYNSIDTLPLGCFAHSQNLIFLDLSGNTITSIPRFVFQGMKELRDLRLKGNPIEEISDGSFYGLSSLIVLDLSDMPITKVLPHTFKGLHSLKSLSLDNSKIQQIYPESFSDSRRLVTLSLDHNPLVLTELDAIENVVAENIKLPERFCCYSHKFSKVSFCSPTPSVFTCSDLLPNVSFKGFAWIMAFFAIAGNIFVIIWRLRLKLPDVPSILILNLSISDLLMGVYLITLAIADVWFSEMYALRDRTWRESAICKLIGVIGLLSCEMSMFTLLLIAFDRTRKLAFPFSSFQFTRLKVWIMILIGWTVFILLSLLPIIFTSQFPNYYSKNSICLPFNFAKLRGPGWELTTALFVGFNSFAIATIISLYTLIYFKLKQSRVKSGRRDFLELQVARKLSVVVITDLACMTPIILTNTLVFMGYDINKHLAAIMASVIIPINSALNPYLFTLKNYIKNYRDIKASVVKAFSTNTST